MAQDFLHGNFALLLIGGEATYGVDPVLTPAANAIAATGWSLKKVVEMQAKKRWGPGFTSRGSCPGQRYAEVEFVVPLAGTPDPGGGNPLVEPDWAPLLKAAGFAVVSTGAPVDAHTYTLTSQAAQDSVTFDAHLYKDGGATVELITCTGCVFDWKLNWSATEAASITFTGMGLYEDNTNPAVPSAPTFIAPSDCLVVQGATITIGGRTDIHTAMEIAGNMSVEKRDSVTSSDGVAGFMRTRGPDASVTGSYDPEKRLTSTYDRWADVEAATTAAFTATLDTAGGTRIVVAGPALQMLSPELQIEVPTARYAQPFVLQQSIDAGDDEISIVITRSP